MQQRLRMLSSCLCVVLLFSSVVVVTESRCQPYLAYNCLTDVHRKITGFEQGLKAYEKQAFRYYMPDEKYCPYVPLLARARKCIDLPEMQSCSAGEKKRAEVAYEDLMGSFADNHRRENCTDNTEKCGSVYSVLRCYSNIALYVKANRVQCTQVEKFLADVEKCDSLNILCNNPKVQKSSLDCWTGLTKKGAECNCDIAEENMKSNYDLLHNKKGTYDKKFFCNGLVYGYRFKQKIQDTILPVLAKCKDTAKYAKLLPLMQKTEAFIMTHALDCDTKFSTEYLLQWMEPPPGWENHGKVNPNHRQCSDQENAAVIKEINDCLDKSSLEHGTLESDTEICGAIREAWACSTDARSSSCADAVVRQAIDYIKAIREDFNQKFKCTTY